MSERPPLWVVDPEDPRTPPQEIWDRMSEAERESVVDSLPSAGDAALPGADDLIEKLEGFGDDLESRLNRAEQRAEEEARRAEEEARRADQEADRARVLEQELKQTRAEIERLKKAGG